MEAIGGISAVTAVLDFGFSLVTAIHAYVGDYKDAPEDIISLAKDIEAVTIEVKAISDLVEHDQAAKDLDEGNSRVAEKCVGELRSFLAKLSELLSEAGISTGTPKDRVPTAEEISKRMKFYWPLIKAKVEEVQRKLDRTRIQILLARSCLEFRVSPTVARRERAQSRIPGLFKLLERQRLADDLLHPRAVELKFLENPGPDALKMQEQRISKAVFDGGRPKRRDTKAISDQADGRSNASYTSENARRAKEYFLKGQEEMLQQLRDAEANSKHAAAELEKIRDEIREELREAKSQEETKVAEQDKLRRDAVEKFKIEEEKKREQQEATRKRLESIFDASSKEQIDQCMQALLQGQGIGIDLGRLAVAPPANKDTSVEVVEDPPRPGTSKEPTQKRVRFSPLSFWRQKPSVTSSSSTRAENKDVESHASDTSESSRQSRLTPISHNSDDAYATVTETRDVTLRLAHLVLSYHTDFINNDECVPFDGTEFQHYPCGKMCDFKTTMRVWARIPQGSKTLALERARVFFGPLKWELHTTLPIEPGPQAQKSSFRGILSRNKSLPTTRGAHVVLVILSAWEKDQITREVYPSRSSSTETRGALTLSKLLAIREWLRANRIDGELGAIDEEIKKRTRSQDPVRSEGPHITARVPTESNNEMRRTRSRRSESPPAPPVPPPTRPDHYTIREIGFPKPPRRGSYSTPSPPPRRIEEEIIIRPRQRNELSPQQGTKDLNSRRIMDVPSERDYAFDDGFGSHTYETLPGGTAIYDRAGIIPRSRSRTPPLADEGHRVRVLDFGPDRRSQPLHPLRLSANSHPVVSFDDSVASDAQALNTALIRYTGGGVGVQDTSNVLEDEETNARTSGHATGEHDGTRLHASPEPIPGLKVKPQSPTVPSCRLT